MSDAYERADAAGCDIVAFPELSTTGYPPEDLVLKPGFVADNLEMLAKLAARTRRCAAVIGFVDQDRDIYNAAAVCANGEVVGTYRKRLLPNNTVFDEARYFTPGDESDPLELYVIGGVKVGISICEDIWSPFGALSEQAAAGAELNININGSPFSVGKGARARTDARHARRRLALRDRLRQPGRRSGRVGLRRGLARRSTTKARCSPAATQFAEQLLVVDVPIPPVYRKRLLDPRGRATRTLLPTVHVSDVADRAERARSWHWWPEPFDADRELYDALVLGHARLLPQERLHRRGDRAVGRHRLHDRRRASPPTRSAPTTSTACRCRRVTRATTRSPTPSCSPRTSASTTARSRSSRRSRPISTCWRRRSRGASRASPTRTSRAGAAARR